MGIISTNNLIQSFLLSLVRSLSSNKLFHRKSSVQFSSVIQLCLTLWDPMNHSTPGLPVHNQLLEFTQTQVHRVGDAIQPSHPLSSPSPPAPNPSQHQGLSNESTLRMRWPKYWSFNFSISPSSEHPGLISFRMDWLDLLAVQGTLKSLLQHHSSKASILRRSGFFTVQLSHPYMTTGKTIALTKRTFVGKVTSLLKLSFYLGPRNKLFILFIMNKKMKLFPYQLRRGWSFFPRMFYSEIRKASSYSETRKGRDSKLSRLLALFPKST